MSRGTAKTLHQAIQNAFYEYKKDANPSEHRLRKLLLHSMRDYVRNRIGPAYAEAEGEVLKELNKFLKSLGR